jgi:eukaryotic-like serine/threonine-protein kinase
MKPERWHEVERLYHLARELEPDKREAFLRETCLGNDSLRKEVESLLSFRPKAEKFIESPALKADARILAEDQPNEPSRNHAPPISEHTGHPSLPRIIKREFPPWWIILLSIPFVTCAGFLFLWGFSSPEPAGWRLKSDARIESEVRYQVLEVRRQSAAARAGIETGDLLRPKDLDQFLTDPPLNAQYRFEIERHGEGRMLTLTLKRKDRDYWRGDEGVRTLLLVITSLPYLILAAVLVVVRPQDTQARWGALLLAQIGVMMLMMGFHSLSSGSVLESAHALRSLPLPLGPAILLGMSLSMTIPAGAFGFLGGFPRTPFTGRRAWSLIWAPAIVTLPIDLRFFWLPVYAGMSGPVIPEWLMMPASMLGLCFLVATVIMLVRNYRKIEEHNERRRLRMVVLGFGLSIFSMAVGLALGIPWGPIERFRNTYMQGSYFEFTRILLLAPAPICTSYAILRHRMFDIRVMVRLGLRYAAARGLLLSIVPLTGLMLVLDLLTHGDQSLMEIAQRRGLIYAAIGLGAFFLHIRQKAWLNALDRRFFRERYDGQQLLMTVVDDIRRSGAFNEAAPGVISQVEGTLHPEFAALMAHEPGAATYRSMAPTCGALPPIPARSKLIALMRLLGKPLENSQSLPGWLQQQLPHDEVEYLRRTRIEWLFPVALGGTGTEAILVLGPKRSQEPYCQEDRDLLSAITGSLALLLERSPVPAASRIGFGECPECGNCYDSGVAVCETDGARLSMLPHFRALARRYWFERRLGRGGMGSVYQALDTELERRVAVKVIRSEMVDSVEAVSRFRREAKAVAGFSHPNVVTIHDFGVDEDNRAYLVMELLTGCTLREALQQSGRLDSNRAFEILQGVSRAVAEAHDRRLLHRDLKPENIFLSRSMAVEVPKILDFGLVKPMKPGEAMESISGTAPGILIGTLPYMSPEQIRGEAPDESWDLWALAVVAFEMLTGVHPFAISSDWRGTVNEGRFPPMNSDTPGLTPPFKEFFERALAVDRSRRPSSARQFIEQLQAAL